MDGMGGIRNLLIEEVMDKLIAKMVESTHGLIRMNLIVIKTISSGYGNGAMIRIFSRYAMRSPFSAKPLQKMILTPHPRHPPQASERMTNQKETNRQYDSKFKTTIMNSTT
jgi:hypothetical protein